MPRADPWTSRVRPAQLSLVAAGGAVGTGSRYLLTLLTPEDGMPILILAINVAGAFLLGLLVELLLRLPRQTLAEGLRLALGTGMLGGFTTYSTLAVDTVTAGSAASSVLLAAGTLVLGLAAAAAGMALGRRRP